jgi:Protein of unknown function./Domain of unknown function (DUF1835).
MIEIMLGESEGGSMKVAKNYKKDSFLDGAGAIGWIGEKPDKAELDKWKKEYSDGEAVGGKSTEVICIPFMLDIGDISKPIDSEYRKNLILDMYTINGWYDINYSIGLEESWKKYVQELERLRSFAAENHEFRIWYSDAPYSLCGLYFACNLLNNYHSRVSIIKLPDYIQLSENEMQFFSSWGEVEPGKFYRFLPLEVSLSTCELNFFSSKWNELSDDNSSLRAVVNGKVIGVPEDFYDHIIKKQLPEGEFIMARLIGDILGNYPLGISDSWYAKRILHMIKQGEIEIVQKQKETYRQILKKV